MLGFYNTDIKGGDVLSSAGKQGDAHISWQKESVKASRAITDTFSGRELFGLLVTQFALSMCHSQTNSALRINESIKKKKKRQRSF